MTYQRKTEVVEGGKENEVEDSKPSYINFGEGNYEPVVDVTDPDFFPVPTVFKVRTKDGVAMERTAANIVVSILQRRWLRKLQYQAMCIAAKETFLS